MSRTARIVCPGIAHHVTQRGNRQQDIFLDDDDRKTYLRMLRHYSAREQLRVLAYCLMTNHIHLIVIPDEPASLARTMRVAHTQYALYANARYDWSGHLFTARYYSCPMDDEHLWTAMRYVESNPTRARLVESPELWEWSSAPTHCGTLLDPMLDTTIMKDWPPSQWHDWLRQTDPDSEQKLRQATRLGHPFGPAAFVRRLELLLRRRLSPRSPDPPNPSPE